MPATPIDKTIGLNSFTFHYRDWGGQGRPIVLLHGLGSTSHIWDLSAPLLAKQHRVVALDQRGHGTSEKPDAEYTFEALVSDLRQLIDKLHFEHPIVVGHSWGGNVVLAYGSLFPDEPSGLVMVDGGTFELSARMDWEQVKVQMAPAPIDGMLATEFRQRISEFYFLPGNILTPEIEEIILANYEVDAEGRIHSRLQNKHHRRIIRAMWEQRPSQIYEHVQAPALIIPARWDSTGNSEWTSLKEQTIATAQNSLAESEVVWFEESVHDIPLQYPQKLADVIANFAAQL